MIRQRLPSFSAFAFILVLCGVLFKHTYSYPILIELSPGERSCLNVDIPEHDDVHFIMSNLPAEVDEEIEGHYMAEIAKAATHGDGFMRQPPTVLPTKLRNIVDEANYDSTITVNMHSPAHGSRPSTYVVRAWDFNLVKKFFSSAGQDFDDYYYYGAGSHSIEVCFQAASGRARGNSHAVFEHIIESEIAEKMRKKHIVKKEHLTPIEESFEDSIVKAREILQEMSFLERRESRMKHTSDSTNSRVRYFSFLSIAILLGVTWLQITYLKSYFKKKKVL